MSQRNPLTPVATALRGRALLIAIGAIWVMTLGACTAESASDPRTAPPLVRTTVVHDAGAVWIVIGQPRRVVLVADRSITVLSAFLPRRRVRLLCDEHRRAQHAGLSHVDR